MLRLAVLIGASAVALGGMAFAADLPIHAPPPVYNWTGFYAGLNGGYHWGESSMAFTGTDTDGLVFGSGLGVAQQFGVIPLTGTSSASGFIGGGQFGYNYQINSFVLGLEFDIDGATGSKNASVSLTNVPEGFVAPTSTQSAQQLDWLGTLRGRIGWTPIDRVLIFGTGGFAFGHSNASFSVFNPQAEPPLYASAYSAASVGWTAGGGIEYALAERWTNWSVKVEYLYYDLGQKTGTVTYQNLDLNNLPEFSTLSGEIRHNGNIVRAGLNYKFN